MIVLTGAGISVASGLAPFRNAPNAIWEQNPKALCTKSYFEKHPDEHWKWFLDRFQGDFKPNRAHHLLAELNLPIITQNIDTLHVQAGSKEVYEVHGTCNQMRCSKLCSLQLLPIDPDNLVCFCGKPRRPNVLWFDESYNEHFYHYESALEAARSSKHLLILGTTITTGLPVLLWDEFRLASKQITVVDTDPDHFASKITDPLVTFVNSTATDYLLKLKEALT